MWTGDIFDVAAACCAIRWIGLPAWIPHQFRSLALKNILEIKMPPSATNHVGVAVNIGQMSRPRGRRFFVIATIVHLDTCRVRRHRRHSRRRLSEGQPKPRRARSCSSADAVQFWICGMSCDKASSSYEAFGLKTFISCRDFLTHEERQCDRRTETY